MGKACWAVLTAAVLLTASDGRTLDGGRVDTSAVILRGNHPIVGGLQKLPLIRAGQEGILLTGLNDIHAGLMDKGVSNDLADDPAPAAAAGTTTTLRPPAVTETNDIIPLEEAEVVDEEILEPEVEAEVEESEEEDIFQDEEDVVIIMKRMYDSLTRRLNMLRTRVNSVEQTSRDVLARLTILDCADLHSQGLESGAYTFHMDHRGKRPVSVVCDMDTDGGGWTVLQQRLPHSKAVDFNRGWHDYKMGFGNTSTDYWVGLENIFIWTNTRHYEMRIVLTDFEGESAYANYDRFYIEDEDGGYRLHVSGYEGTAGDSLTNGGKPDNFTADGMMFTTHDEDHDTSHEINCAKYWKIGGWWFNRCSWANLNGPAREPGEGDGIGINWHMWRNKEYLRSSAIMIRPARNP